MSAPKIPHRPGLDFHPDDDGGVSVRPASPEQVASVVATAAEQGRVVYAGEAPPPGSRARGEAIRVDLSRLANELAFEGSSLLLHAQAGMRLGELLVQANARGGFLLPLPARTRRRTVGAVLSAPRAVEGGSRGRLIEACAAVEAVLADGRVIATRRAPRKASGPDLMQALLGARGATGIITSAWLRLTRAAPEQRIAGWSFTDGLAALGAARAFLRHGGRPVDIVLADPAWAGPAASALGPSRVLLAIHFDGAPELVGAEEVLAARLVAEHAGQPIDDALVAPWLLEGEPDPALPSRFVPDHLLARTWSTRTAPSFLRALSPAGAAIVPGVAPPVPASVARHREVLARALDPEARFAPDPRVHPRVP